MTGFNGNLSTAYYGKRDLPRSFAEAAQRWSEWRANPRRRRRECKLANNTVLVHHTSEPERYAVRLHETDVVTFYRDGSVKLDSGGWQTFTTRDRMTRCGFRVGMSGGIASVSHGGREWTYADGMTLIVGGISVRYFGFVNDDPASALKLRRRRLALVKRLEKKANALGVYVGDMLASWSPEKREKCAGYFDAWYWPNRSGGHAVRGNAPEAFEAAA